MLLARNPSPMTLDGTNTWLLRATRVRAVPSWSTPARTTTGTSTRVAAAAGDGAR